MTSTFQSSSNYDNEWAHKELGTHIDVLNIGIWSFANANPVQNVQLM